MRATSDTQKNELPNQPQDSILKKIQKSRDHRMHQNGEEIVRQMKEKKMIK